MNMLHLDFMKVDTSVNGKENTSVMTRAFSKLSIATVTLNQKAKWLQKPWSICGFTLTESQPKYTVIRGNALISIQQNNCVNYAVYNNLPLHCIILTGVLHVNTSIAHYKI